MPAKRLIQSSNGNTYVEGQIGKKRYKPREYIESPFLTEFKRQTDFVLWWLYPDTNGHVLERYTKEEISKFIERNYPQLMQRRLL